MTPPKLTPREKPQPLELLLDGDEHQGSDFLPKAHAIDATGNTMNHKSTMGLLTNWKFCCIKGGNNGNWPDSSDDRLIIMEESLVDLTTIQN